MWRRFLEDLIAGDTVALIAAGIIGAIAIVIGGIWFKISRDLRKEDEERAKKKGKKPKGK